MEQLEALRHGFASLTPGMDRSVTWAVVTGLAVLFFAIQLLQPGSEAKSKGDGPRIPPSHPSWVPFFGHAPQFALDRESFLSRLRNLYPGGLYSVRLLGKSHSIVYSPSFTATILSKPRAVVDSDFLLPNLLTSNFGMSRPDAAHYVTLSEKLTQQLHVLLTDEGLNFITSSAVTQLKGCAADFVTFNSSPADQADWEVRAGATVVESSKGESYVEADLMELVRNFLSKTANQGLFGSDFVENFPDAWDHIWKYDEGFVEMTIMPSWLPLPRVTRARAAGYKFRQHSKEFIEALDKYLDGEDPGSKWPDLDNVSPLVKDRARIFREANMSANGRAGSDLALAWAMNANANPLTSWMVWEIARDPIILERIREEITPYVEVVQPKNDFGPAVWVAPEINKVDIDGLVTKCPLLKAAYVETLRVYTSVWNLRHSKEDFVLSDRGKSKESFVIPKDRFIHMPQHVHQFDPAYFPDPMEWHPQRHVRETVDDQGNRKYSADLGTIKPYSGGSRMCKGRAFALREMMLYPAVILSLYDIEAPEGEPWKMPKTETRAATRHPLRPLRVWIKRRELPTKEKSHE